MSYRKGAQFEYRVKSIFEKEGYYVVRSAGSHGIADLVAIHPPLYLMLGNKVVLIQCSVKPKPLSEVIKLVELCDKLRCIPCLAFKEGHKVKIIMGNEVKEYINRKRSTKDLNKTPTE